MGETRIGDDGPPDRLSSGVDTRDHIVPLVRNWLSKGVSSNNIKTSVRIQDIKELSGGLKSPVVGTVTVSVDLIIKQGSEELHQHRILMNGVNLEAARKTSSRKDPTIFPEVMSVEVLMGQPSDRNHLMIMQCLRKFETLFDLIFTHGNASLSGMVLGYGVERLRFLHQMVPPKAGDLAELPRNPDPFTSRLNQKLDQIRAAVSWLEPIFQEEWQVDDHKMPPLSQVFPALERWQKSRVKKLQLRLVHGDPHMANLMYRRRGKTGFSIRWIDPNPLIGFSDPAYDWGKVLHFLEPVGWLKKDPCAFVLKRSKRKGATVLRILPNISFQGSPAGVETVRIGLEQQARAMALGSLSGESSPEALLDLAVASAHVGFAALLSEKNSPTEVERKARDAAIGFTLRSLARWHTRIPNP